MIDVFIKAGSYIFIIILAYSLKKIKFFQEGDHRLISKIILNITLPAAILSSFQQVDQLTGKFLWFLWIGLFSNIFLLTIAWIFCNKKTDQEKIHWMCNTAGYNIGCFTIPYAQGFLGSIGVVTACLFDAGNSIMCTGGTYAVASAVVSKGKSEGFQWKETCKKLLSSVPFDCYMIALALRFLEIEMPRFVNQVSNIIGNANGFLSMLMIGMMLEFHFDKKHMKKIFSVLTVRYLFGACMAFLCYFYLPFSLDIRQAFVIISLAPLPSLSCVFTERCNGDIELASMTNSLSILISMILMTICIMIM